jgi:hypothetical protein
MTSAGPVATLGSPIRRHEEGLLPSGSAVRAAVIRLGPLAIGIGHTGGSGRYGADADVFTGSNARVGRLC